MSDTFIFIKKNKTVNYSVSKPGYIPTSGSFTIDGDKTINVTLQETNPIVFHLTFTPQSNDNLPETIAIYGTCDEAGVNSDTSPREQYFSDLLFTFETTNGLTQTFTIPKTYANIYLRITGGYPGGDYSRCKVAKVNSCTNCDARIMGYSYYEAGVPDAVKVILDYSKTDAYVNIYQYIR